MIVKIIGSGSSGMAEEYEIIRTDAPNQVIEEQLKRYYDGEPYELLTNSGYAVEIVGSQYDFDDGLPDIDKEFDLYGYID